MNKLKYLLTFLIVSLISLPAFADNIGRNVYSIYSETYNGVHIYDPGKAEESDIDAVCEDKWEYVEWIFGNESYSDSESVVEGQKYHKFTATKDNNYLGIGFSAQNADKVKNMESYFDGTIKFYIRCSKADRIDNIKNHLCVGIKFGDIETFKTGSKKTVGDFGFSSDSSNIGKWQELSITLDKTLHSDLDAREKLRNTKILFVLFLDNPYVKSGDTFDIDNIRWVKATKTEPTFKVTLKDVAYPEKEGKAIDNPLTEIGIAWEPGTEEGWKVAKQYLEISLDDVFEKNNWSIHAYTNNEGNKEGLVSEDGKHNIPMCWRMETNALDYTDGSGKKHTTDIGFYVESDPPYTGHLYDKGLTPEFAYYEPWLFMVNGKPAAGSSNYDYSTIWNYKGIHYASGPSDFGSLGDLTDRTAKFYLGCNTDKVEQALYSTTVILDLIYE